MRWSDYVAAGRKFWMSIVACVLLGLLLAAAYVLVSTPTYTSRATLFVSVQSSSSSSDLAAGSSFAQAQVRSYAQIAETPYVLDPVIKQERLDTTAPALAGRVKVTVPANTAVLELTVTDTDPERAARTAQAIGQQLIVTVSQLAPRNQAGKPTTTATLVAPASAPTSWTSPNVGRVLALGLLSGLAVGLGQAILRTVLDTRVRNADDVARITSVPVVATIPLESHGTNSLSLLDAPGSLAAEEIRRLRTNVQFLAADQAGAIAVSSSGASEGKTSTVTNLALALTMSGKSVLLIDADMRRPTVASRLGLEGSAGLSTVLIGRADLEDVVQPAHGMDVLTSGRIPPNPGELIGSERMRSLLEQAVAAYDYVLVDTPPLGPVADAAELSSMVKGVLLVVGSGSPRRAELQEAISSVTTAEGTILGIVINKLKAADAGSRQSLYYRRETYAADEKVLESVEVPQNPPARARSLDGEWKEHDAPTHQFPRYNAEQDLNL